MTTRYPKRLIEVDLPIKRISAHARREKSIRHGHISTLHIWWARRPLAACRAVICASLWPDPADELCPESFRDVARAQMQGWAEKYRHLLGQESMPRFIELNKEPRKLDDHLVLRQALLDFIADFANWDNSTVKEYLVTSRILTQAAHEALGGAPGTRPLVVDPFAGGGSIPLEALRVGADAFASDLNPVAVLLNKVVLEYVPKYGERLAHEVRKWGEWIKREAENELAEFYPKDPDGATPIAYLWARTIQCEGPACGAEVPLIRSLWLAKKTNGSVALQLLPRPRAKRVDLQIIVKQRGGWVDQDDPKTKIEAPKFDGTVKRGSGSCSCCGYTTPVARIREQFRARRGGANDARLLCVVTTKQDKQGRFFRLPKNSDFQILDKSRRELKRRGDTHDSSLSLIPNEPLPRQGTLGFRVQLYGMLEWGDLFTHRQALALSVFVEKITQVSSQMTDRALSEAVQSCLALVLGRLADRCSSLCRYDPSPNMSGINNTFSRQALPMIWDFGEGDPKSERSGGWSQGLGWLLAALEQESKDHKHSGQVASASACSHPLPDDSAAALITDPPYYDAVPYADLSDFFFVWLKRSLANVDSMFTQFLTPKDGECIVDAISGKDRVFYETAMKQAMAEARRVLAPTGIGIVVFAHKSTGGWEAQLQAMVDAGWTITGSWPIDTEMGNRLRAMDSAALASSVHLVCRPRENPDGSVRTDEIGDWRDVLQELPRRIHEWMPRLAEEGVVGADAIFACLGPALEVFSRYSRVEKASGETVTLKEYLEQVWAAVAKEALTLVFESADTTGFEPDARLTAMWLWTLNAGATDVNNGEGGEEEESDDESEGDTKKAKTTGFVLEYDAARKIAQGLGAHLEELTSMVEVKGDKARLLPVAERTKALFGKDESGPAAKKAKKKAKQQMSFGFQAELEAAEEEQGWGVTGAPASGQTVLDRIHQSMILFAAGRSEALKRFLVDDGAGRDERFWRLAQALSALYPSSTDEKRWVDGVLARKKGLGC